jgi:hypothetical protein
VFARFRQVCDAELPGLTGALVAAGCTRFNYLDRLPPTMADRSARPGDAAADAVTGRRPVIEAVPAASPLARRDAGGTPTRKRWSRRTSRTR